MGFCSIQVAGMFPEKNFLGTILMIGRKSCIS